ncbi:MAG TPA: thioredoxin family protein [Clostridia bacterium]|nr:thioredoxin family protein [Clostridia bacterium]
MQNKRLLQILVPVLIVVAVSGLFLIKNVGDKDRFFNGDKNSQSTLSNSNNDNSLYASDISMETLTSYGLPFLIDFGSPSCVWCVRMEPTLKKMHDEYDKKVTVRYLDLSKYSKQADGYPVSAIPAQFFFNSDGTAFTPSSELQQIVKFDFYKDDESGKTMTGHVGALSESELRSILDEMVSANE